jgi:hypothetical protein
MNPRDHFEGVGDSASDFEDTDGGTVSYVPAIQAPLSRDDFEYYWSEELVTLYHVVKDHCSQYGWPVFDELTFCDFCKFAYDTSSKAKPLA